MRALEESLKVIAGRLVDQNKSPESEGCYQHFTSHFKRSIENPLEASTGKFNFDKTKADPTSLDMMSLSFAVKGYGK